MKVTIFIMTALALIRLRALGHAVQFHLRIGPVVDGRRHPGLEHAVQGKNRFHRAACAHGMTKERLVGAERRQMPAEDSAQRRVLGQIACLGGGGMGVDHIDPLRGHGRVGQRI